MELKKELKVFTIYIVDIYNFLRVPKFFGTFF